MTVEDKWANRLPMLRNLFLAIFLFALALPALAVPVAPVAASEAMPADCHGMPMGTQDDDAEEHGKAVQLHGCIGCIAPVSPGFAVFQSASLPCIPQSALLHELLGTIARPTIPPAAKLRFERPLLSFNLQDYLYENADYLGGR